MRDGGWKYRQVHSVLGKRENRRARVTLVVGRIASGLEEKMWFGELVRRKERGQPGGASRGGPGQDLGYLRTSTLGPLLLPWLLSI